MKENRTHHYEIMCLLRQTAAADLGAAVDHIRETLTRHGGEILAMSKWDERRLAYEIEKQKRGAYILTYATLPTASLAAIERDFNLSEIVLRYILLRADHLTVEEMQATDARQALADEIALRAERQREREEAKAAEPAPADA
ncbi:MAG: 30S ribosomal protein S6 [Planctomycetota bacterium]|nr:MAG: 30S ribosomal protein S6 [Planctomycetota bacterium]